MIFGSVCSGIEATSVAWQELGWQAAWYSEIDPFCCAVLAQRHPHIPNLGDLTLHEHWNPAAVDLLVGGTPCQSFSVAGRRAGVDDPRGELTFVYLDFLRTLRPRWLIWENVPGVLSIDGGRTFGAFLWALAQLGYGFAWRVLDAQYFGVPQRRMRLFVVGHLGDHARAAAVLLERHSLRGHPTPRLQAGEDITGCLASRTRAGGGLGTDFECSGGLVAERVIDCSANGIAGTVTAKWSKGTGGPAGDEHYNLVIRPDVTHTLTANHDASEDGTGRGVPLVTAVNLRGRAEGNVPETSAVASLRAASGGSSRSLVAFSCKDDGRDAGVNAPTLRAMGYAQSHANAGGQIAVANHAAVRRLTPRECERLQGFPDDYTLVTYRGKPAADGPRYRALGNSMAVPVMRWIGERIGWVERLLPSVSPE